MALDLWYRGDVERILAAIGAAGDLRGPEYHKALADVAIAFGVRLPASPAPAPAEWSVVGSPNAVEVYRGGGWGQ